MSKLIFSVTEAERSEFLQTGCISVNRDFLERLTSGFLDQALVRQDSGPTGVSYFAVANFGTMARAGDPSRIICEFDEIRVFPSAVRLPAITFEVVETCPDDVFAEIEAMGTRPHLEEEHEVFGRPVRSTVERQQILTNYGFRCAITGAQYDDLRSAEAGLEVVDLRPLDAGGEDAARNCIPLRPLWASAVKHGFLTFADDLTIEVGPMPVRPPEPVNPSGKLLVPSDPSLGPAVEALRWHRSYARH